MQMTGDEDIAEGVAAGVKDDAEMYEERLGMELELETLRALSCKSY